MDIGYTLGSRYIESPKLLVTTTYNLLSGVPCFVEIAIGRSENNNHSTQLLTTNYSVAY